MPLQDYRVLWAGFSCYCLASVWWVSVVCECPEIRKIGHRHRFCFGCSVPSSVRGVAHLDDAPHRNCSARPFPPGWPTAWASGCGERGSNWSALILFWGFACLCGYPIIVAVQEVLPPISAILLSLCYTLCLFWWLCRTRIQIHFWRTWWMAICQLIWPVALKWQLAVFFYQTIVPWCLRNLISATSAIFLEPCLATMSKFIRSGPRLYWNCSKLFCWVVLTASLIQIFQMLAQLRIHSNILLGLRQSLWSSFQCPPDFS